MALRLELREDSISNALFPASVSERPEQPLRGLLLVG